MRVQSVSHNVCRPLIEAAQIDRFGFDVELILLAPGAVTPARDSGALGSH